MTVTRPPLTPKRVLAAGLTMAAIVIPLTTMVSHAFGRATYPLLLPAIKDELALSNTQAGVGGTAIFAAYLTGVIIVTLVSGAIEPGRILRVGLAVSGVGLLLCSAAPNFGILVIGLVLTNASGAGIWLTAPLLATEGVPANRRGIVIGFLTGAIGLATSAVALGTRLARSEAGDPNLWRPVYLVEAMLTIAILGTVIGLVRARSTARIRGGGIRLDGLRALPGWKPLTAGYVAFGAIAAAYSSFLAEALETDGGLARSTVSNMYIGLGLSSMIGAPTMGWVSDRGGRKRALMVVMAFIVVVSGAVAVASGPVLMVIVVCLGGMWGSYPTLTATFVRDHLEDRVFGSAYGTLTIFYSLAAVPAPIIAGVVADQRASFAVSYLAIAALGVFALVALSRLPPARSGNGS